ncbi:MAG: beta-propeller domain-containing protein [Polyangiaceae bacterium]
MNRKTLSFVALTSIALIYACNHSDGGSPSGDGGAGADGKGGARSDGTAGASSDDEETAAAVALQPLTSCTDFNDAIREKTRREMNSLLDTAIKNLKTQGLTECINDGYGYGSTTGTTGVAWGATTGTTTGSSTGTTTGSSTGFTGTTTGTSISTGTASESPTSVSGTNNQVAAVDEADIVKTDGQYIYWVENNELRIVDAWPATDAATVGRLGLGSGRVAKKLFVEGDRAVVYVSEPRSTAPNGSVYMLGQAKDCTYGYDCDFSGDGTATRMMVFDVSNRSLQSSFGRSRCRVRSLRLVASAKPFIPS